MQVAYIPMNSVKCGILTALYGNFRMCGTRFYPVRCGAVQDFSNGLAIVIIQKKYAIIQSFLKTYLEIIEYLDNLFRKLRVFSILFSTIAIAI